MLNINVVLNVISDYDYQLSKAGRKFGHQVLQCVYWNRGHPDNAMKTNQMAELKQ